jgi:hypothetical protein
MFSSSAVFSDTSLRVVSSKTIENTKRASKWNDYYFAETALPLRQEQINNPWLWDELPRKFMITYVYPKFNGSEMTKADWNISDYEKEPDLLQCPNALFIPPYTRDVTLREIRTCETLRRAWHPNVCYYRGVRVDDRGLVRGLMFDRYDMTLREMLYKGHKINIPACLRDIENGIKHIHSLGLVHCDIKPANIFVHLRSQRFIVGDFDSMHHEGDRLVLKCGTDGWVPEDEETLDVARYKIDWYSLDMIGAWLEKKTAFEYNINNNHQEDRWTTNILHDAGEKVLKDIQPSKLQDSFADEGTDEDTMDTSW